RTEVLDAHFAAIDQALRGRTAAGVLQIEGNTPLPTVEESVGRCLPARPCRRVNVDDIGALVAQHHGGQWTGNVVTEIDGAHPSECPSHGLGLFREPAPGMGAPLWRKDLSGTDRLHRDQRGLSSEDL